MSDELAWCVGEGVGEDGGGDFLLLFLGRVMIIVSGYFCADEGVDFVPVIHDRVHPGVNGDGITHVTEVDFDG